MLLPQLLALALASAHARLPALVPAGALARQPAAAPTSAQWSSIAIGGGGYVLQTHVHPTTGHVYLRTDVGGVYLRSATTSPLTPNVPYSWTPLLEWVSPSDSDYYATSALAMDPADGAIVYLLTGSYWAYSNCSVLASRDAGATWAVTAASQGWGLRCGGNEGDRAVGDRMAVHPALPGTIAVGGSDGRVYVTASGFASAPTGVALPAPAAPGPCNPGRNATCVVRSVLWLRPAGAPGALLLAAVPALGLFASAGPDYADASTWSFVAGSGAPAEVNRLVADPAGGSGGGLWATAASGGVWAGEVAGDGAGGWAVHWRVAGALAGAGVPFSGIAVGATGADVAAMSMEYNSNTSLWRSADGGATWARANWSMTSSVPWWTAYSLALNAASSLSFEEGGSAGGGRTLWATDFFGVYYAPADAPGGALAFTSAEAGHEEVCVNVLRAPALGAVVSGSADVGGFVHSLGLDAYPPRAMAAHDGWAHNCLFDAAFTLTPAPSGASQDALWVTAGDEYGSCHGAPSWCGLHSWVGVSRDGGATFADTAWDSAYAVDQANPYRVAVHPADGARALVAARAGLPLSFTRDWGATWGNASVGGRPLASSGVQGNFWFAQPLARENNDAAAGSAAAEATFYYYNGTTTLFASTDSGATFTPMYSGFPSWNTPLFGIATPPAGAAAAGDVWAFAGWKLYHSTNFGANFSQVWEMYSVDRVIAVGPLPAVPGGRSAGELALACAARAQAASGATATAPRRPLPPRLPSGAAPAYAVYAVGPQTYEQEGLYGSIDFGHSWVKLSGANSSTPLQALGDTPQVLEASLQQPGVLLVGTEGRGGYVRNVTEDLVRALLSCGE